MATIPVTSRQDFTDGSFASWTPMTTTNSDGIGAQFLGAGDRCIQVTGTFGAAGTVVAEGSLDNTNWFGLRDPSSTLISFTAAGLKAILEATPYVRARVTGGDGTTSLTAIVYTRRALNG